jgi:hypothetical protein
MEECICELDRLRNISIHFHSLNANYYIEDILQSDVEYLKSQVIYKVEENL